MILRLLTLILLPLLATAAEKPNIIIVLADDMGIGDMTPSNPDCKIKTPHLQKMADEGMTFFDAHTSSAVCTPTRYGVLTGRYCWRTRLKRGVLNGYGEPLIEPERSTVGHLLSRAGYTTGIVGKWHLGLGFAKDGPGWGWKYLPTRCRRRWTKNRRRSRACCRAR